MLSVYSLNFYTERTKRSLRIALLGRWIPFAIGLMLCTQAAYAQQLSIRRYDLHDGLAHSAVKAIHQDLKGYLWFGTWEGLSRFDGYRFINYDTDDGLGHVIINAITEDLRGRLWVATNGGGVSRLIDDPREADSLGIPRKTFKSFNVGDSPDSNRVNDIVFDSDNNLWCATDGGLYRASTENPSGLSFEVVVPHSPLMASMTALADSKQRLWFTVHDELIEIVQGRIIKYGVADGLPPGITGAVEDHRGRVFLTSAGAVFEFIEPSDPLARGRWGKAPVAFSAGQKAHRLYVDSGGALWICTNKGLIRHKETQTLYTTAQGLSDDYINAVAEDRDGNLWIATADSGVCKLAGDMIVSLTRSDGLPQQNFVKVVEDRSGRIYTIAWPGDVVEIAGGKVIPIPESQLPPLSDMDVISQQRILQDRQGYWWVGTGRGLFRFEGPELRLRHGSQLTRPDGVPRVPIDAIYQDPAGRVWATTRTLGTPTGSSRIELYCFDPARSSQPLFERIPLGRDLPATAIYWMVSDRSENLWLGAQFGWVGRLRNGTIEFLQPTGGLPETLPRAIFLDSRGWLWIGLRYKGVSVTRDPNADVPEFVNYSTADGLASNNVKTISEDDAGRIYLGTSKGLNRLDPLTGKIESFTVKDGLAGSIINYCMKDRSGNIWVATNSGLSKLNLRAEPVSKHPPAIFMSRVQVAGEEIPIAETGSVRVTARDLTASRNNLLIEYVGLGFRGEREIRYQYKLEGADSDWSAPTDLRSVNYAQLAPGSYRFLVRAFDRHGIESAEPAVFEFRILPPIWLRWWFISFAALILSGTAYAFYRYRLRRVIELERVRTRLASDLHDDIGSNLSLIAGLSEALGQQARPVDSQMAERLSIIASVSRRSIDAMSDIVWAVNPKRDNLLDLAHRMRRFASDSFTARNIEFHFDSPQSEQNVKIGSEVRRELFLVFKEGVNNIVRHSGCRRAEVGLEIDRRMIILKLSDDGGGFDQSRADYGQGLASMRRRAEKLGGELLVISSTGAGTSVILKAPLGRHD